jgi:hypothetical protein
MSTLILFCFQLLLATKIAFPSGLIQMKFKKLHFMGADGSFTIFFDNLTFLNSYKRTWLRRGGAHELSIMKKERKGLKDFFEVINVPQG